jgi:hypothetical protein
MAKTSPSTIIKHDGVLAVVTTTETSGLTESLQLLGSPKHFGVAQLAIGLFRHTEESSIRVVVGESTISALRSTSGIAALVVTTGHPVVKSVQRMMRKLLRGMATATESKS